MHSGFSGARIFLYLKKNWFVLVAVIVYLFFASYYMGPGFSDCSNSIYGFGDSTAGPIWRNSLEPEQPLFGGDENKTNYPYGESLYSPVGYVASVQTIFMGSMSEVVGPVCAYNLYNILGYVFTALVMFFFIRYLTKKEWIALFAGYAVSYTPYIQSKIGGHPNYAFGGILIAIIWLTLHLLTHRNKWTAALLGLSLAICAYLDPYFTLLAATIVIPIVCVWLFIERRRVIYVVKNIRTLNRKKILPFGIAILVFVTLLTPLAAVRIKDAGVIDKAVSKSRGNVVEAAKQCSNMPLDYLLPDPTNVFFVKIFGSSYQTKNIQHRNWCGFGESRVSLSLTLLGIIFLAATVTAWERLNRFRNNETKLRYDKTFVLLGVVGVGVFALCIGLPPYIHGFLMPSGMILEVTEMWRIFAREYLVVNIAVIILAAIALTYFSACRAFTGKRITEISLLTFVALGVLCEYQINAPFSPMTFNYSRDVPSVYKDLREDSSVKVIAEYPMDRIGQEHDSVVYYMTMQGVHMKSMVNSVLSTDSREATHISIKDLSDPQTIPALRYLGVDRIVVHGESVKDVLSATGGQLSYVDSSMPPVYGLTMVRQDDNRTVALFTVDEGNKDSNILTIQSGYSVNLPLIQSPISTEYEITNGAVLKETQLGKQSIQGQACFEVKMSAPSDTGILTIQKNGNNIISRQIAGHYERIRVPIKTGDEIILKNDKGYNMRLNNLNGECGGQ